MPKVGETAATAEWKKVEAVSEVDGYVWCEARGMIHDTTISHVTTAQHNGTTFYDIYQDGQLCCDADHQTVYTAVTD